MEGITYNNQFEVAGKALNIPLYAGMGYYSGNVLAKGLGLDEQAQETYGRMSAANYGMMGASTLLNTLSRRKEARERFAYANAQDYSQLPYDQYAYDAYSNTKFDGNYFKEGGIPERYQNMGFSKVGQKKNSTRDGKKWMVLAKKGDQYKVVHGGDSSMKDFSQHKDKDRQKRFWDRMGGKNSAKAKDPFSPLYWHKRFGKWEDGGEYPISNEGLYEFPEQDVIVPSNRITMQGINYPVMAYPDNDAPMMMQPNQEYYFPNSKRVLERPMFQDGGEVWDATSTGETTSEMWDATPEPIVDEPDEIVSKVPYVEESPFIQNQFTPTVPKGGSIAVTHNNPGNIKMGNFASGYGATPGRQALDGGVFAMFPSVEAGLDAQRALLKGKNYLPLTVDQAMKRWSNSGYGGEIYPEIGNKRMSELSDAELRELQRRQIKREDGNMYKQIYNA